MRYVYLDSLEMKTTKVQNAFRVFLGIMLLYTGTGHLTFLRQEFLAQVPPWIPVEPGVTVLLSGIVELMIGLGLIFWMKKKSIMGWIAAIFFILIFPGNIAQLTEHRDAFGLNSDAARWGRLLLQPMFIFVALWSTGAWRARNHPSA